MGSGSTKVKQVNKSIQVPSATEPQHPPKKPPSPVFIHVKKQPPPPPKPQSDFDDKFYMETNIEDYSSIWDQETKVYSIV